MKEQTDEHRYFKAAQAAGVVLIAIWTAILTYAIGAGAFSSTLWWLSFPLVLLGFGGYAGGRFLQWFYFGGHA